MATKEQIAANRRNAQLSTGPRTPEGKARTAQNARTHGLMSHELRTPFEEEEHLISHAKAIKEQYDPQSEMEFILVDQIIFATWRLRRIRRIETRHHWHRADDLRENRERSGDQYDDETQVVRDDSNGPKFLDNLARHESRLERSFFRSLHELQYIQAHRPDPPPQEDLQKQPNSEQPPCNPVDTVAPDGPETGVTPAESVLTTDVSPGIPDNPFPIPPPPGCAT